jgi:YVTN family beta-propeller protein
MKHRLAAAALSLAALSTLATAAAAQHAGEYRVVKRTVLGGEGFWDYLTVDAPGDRLFISRGTRVVVVSLADDKVAGEVAPTPGVHGIALAHALGKGFTSNGRDSTVTVFDLKTLRTTGTVHVTGRNPDAIAYDPASRRVFTMNGGSGNVTAIDAANDHVAGTVTLAGRPEFAVADGHGHLWINLEDKSEIEEIDTHALRSLGHWKLAGCDEPSGLAMDVAHERLFSVCSNKAMSVFDALHHRVVATVPIGTGPDAAAFDPGTQTAFSSNGGDGTLTVVHEDSPDHYTVRQTVETQRGARTMALDPRTHRVYTVTAEFGPAPAPTPDNPRPRRTMVPCSFVLLTLARE